MEPICPSSQFVNEENKCVEKDSCTSAEKCNGEGGGSYDADLNSCFCDNV